MSRTGNPFRPAALLGLVLGGAAIFLLLLYAIGAGWTGGDDRDGGAHAASTGLAGYAGLASLLERQGFDVTLSRSRAALDNEALLVLTPHQFTDPDDLQEIIDNRRYVGPTLLILPKWFATQLPTDDPRIEAEEGWVALMDTMQPAWFAELDRFDNAALAIGATSGWSGLGLSGALPDKEQVQAVVNPAETILAPLVRDAEGDLLAGYRDGGGYYPVLAEAAGERPSEEEADNLDRNAWPLVVVVEPDLVNNYGLAELDRARLAMALVGTTLEDYDLPVVFDLTLPGLGAGENLLTLAFRPPFLAATLCLILALFVIGWRSFRRFGPPVAEQPALVRGKRQLAANGASLVERARRWHLLGSPYAALVTDRLARELALRERGAGEREAAIDRLQAARGGEGPPYSTLADRLRRADSPAELLRAASALASIERTLTQ
jgi:hypothetical protein